MWYDGVHQDDGGLFAGYGLLSLFIQSRLGLENRRVVHKLDIGRMSYSSVLVHFGKTVWAHCDTLGGEHFGILAWAPWNTPAWAPGYRTGGEHCDTLAWGYSHTLAWAPCGTPLLGSAYTLPLALFHKIVWAHSYTLAWEHCGTLVWAPALGSWYTLVLGHSCTLAWEPEI